MQATLSSSKRGSSNYYRCERVLNSFLAPWICTMLKVLTKKLRNQSLNEIQPFKLKISCPPSDEEDSDDSEGENQELAQIDRERRRNCTLTPLANNQLQNQENQCCKMWTHFPAGLDRHSSEEELERISREFAAEKRKWSQVNRLACCGDSYNTSSSDEEVKNLCGMSFRPVVEAADGFRASSSPVLFSASPPKRLQSFVRTPTTRPLIFTSVGASFEQVMPCKRHRQGYGDKISRPSLDLEKMQQKMLFKKSCGAKSRVIKIRVCFHSLCVFLVYRRASSCTPVYKRTLRTFRSLFGKGFFKRLQVVAGDLLGLQLISKQQRTSHLEKMVILEGGLCGTGLYPTEVPIPYLLRLHLQNLLSISQPY